MTTVITRFFDTAAGAMAARYELLYRQGVSQSIMRVFDERDGLAEKLMEADVAAETAQVYQDRMAKGGAVLMVRAGYKPLGVAQKARDAAAENGASLIDGLVEEVTVQDRMDPMRKVMTDHPLFLTRRRDPHSSTFHMANWPIPLIWRRRPVAYSAFPPHARMADFILPLLSDRKPYTGSIFPRHARMARFPIRLISKRKPMTASIFPRHARMAAFPIPLLSRRKPFTGTLIGRHTRMANWPFPHLINGQQGTNSLVPGGARMANFPIRLLSKRKPFTGSIVPRHGRMANFPIKLLSKRKPYTGSVIEPHGRMADIVFPLVVKNTVMEEGPGDPYGWSFSKLFRIPTLIRR